jgi:hypothetical protein
VGFSQLLPGLFQPFRHRARYYASYQEGANADPIRRVSYGEGTDWFDGEIYRLQGAQNRGKEAGPQATRYRARDDKRRVRDERHHGR